MSATLTIAIPTYKRPAALPNTVACIFQQLTSPDDRLLIIDNDPAGSAAVQLQQYGNEPRVRVMRNCCNIGGNANILRCIEYADTEYVWLLGDDDEVESDALAVIHADIVAHEYPAHINYALRDVAREKTVVCSTLSKYIGAIGRLNDLWLISNWVYHVPTAKRQMVHSYNLLSSCAPHIVLGFASLKYERVRGVLSARHIVIGHAASAAEGGWSILNFCLLRGTLLNFDLSSAERLILRRKLVELMPVLRHCAFMLALRAVTSDDAKGAREQFTFIYNTNFLGANRINLWMQYQLLAALLYCPKILIQMVKFCKGREFYEKWSNYDHVTRI